MPEKPIEEEEQGEATPLEERGIYRFHARNLSVGVYDGQGGFIGIREKFGSTYLFTEYGWEQGPPYGTVHTYGRELIGRVPPEIPLKSTLGSKCRGCNQKIEFNGETNKWDGCAGCEKILPVSVLNQALYWVLEAQATPQEKAQWSRARNLWGRRTGAVTEPGASTPSTTPPTNPQSSAGEET